MPAASCDNVKRGNDAGDAAGDWDEADVLQLHLGNPGASSMLRGLDQGPLNQGENESQVP